MSREAEPWATKACTLPHRGASAEFDALFADAVSDTLIRVPP
ncbi:hypothetical protein [Lentzea pudingi]|nr:hypothetical protein [Lentzea pudingi]